MLGDRPDVFPVMIGTYPALFEQNTADHLVYVTLEFLQYVYDNFKLNAVSLNEMADILTKNGQTVFFSVPAVPVASDEAKRNAVRDALLEFSKKKPKVFASTAKIALHSSGFNASGFSKGEVEELVKEMLTHEAI